VVCHFVTSGLNVCSFQYWLNICSSLNVEKSKHILRRGVCLTRSGTPKPEAVKGILPSDGRRDVAAADVSGHNICAHYSMNS
jgi:hypothetical protein